MRSRRALALKKNDMIVYLGRDVIVHSAELVVYPFAASGLVVQISGAYPDGGQPFRTLVPLGVHCEVTR